MESMQSRDANAQRTSDRDAWKARRDERGDVPTQGRRLERVIDCTAKSRDTQHAHAGGRNAPRRDAP